MKKIGNVVNMGEKRGFTGKLIFEFNTAASLEVEYKPGKWARVTPNEFRASNYPRRVNDIKYQGPIYIFDTNTVVKEPTKTGIQFVNDKDPRISKKRPNE